MDSDSSSPWNSLLSFSTLTSSSKSYLSALQSRPDMFMDGFDENDIEDDDDDVKEEFLCPFCSEYFDIVGLCCHIDEEHPVEAKNGVCPVCALRVGVDMVAHIALQHGSILKVQRKRKSRKGGSYSTLSLLRKELREGNLQSLLGGSSFTLSSSNAAPDPLLSSFILPVADELSSSQSQPNFLTGTMQSRKSLDETLSKKSGILLGAAYCTASAELLDSDAVLDPTFLFWRQSVHCAALQMIQICALRTWFLSISPREK